MDKGTWWAIVRRIAKCQTQLMQLGTHACIAVAMFAWVDLGSYIAFDTKDILEVGLAWLYPWRVWVITQGTQSPPSPPQPGSWICWKKYKLLKNMWQKATFERKTSFYWRISSVQFSRSVVPDSMRLRELQHTRPPCPSPTPGVHPNSCPLSRWCHPAILSSVIPFSSCPQSLPASDSFPMSQLFAWGGQSTL